VPVSVLISVVKLHIHMEISREGFSGTRESCDIGVDWYQPCELPSPRGRRAGFTAWKEADDDDGQSRMVVRVIHPGREFTKVGPRPRVYDVGARGCGDLPRAGRRSSVVLAWLHQQS